MSIKSLKYPKGKEGSTLYQIWLKAYGVVRADEMYKEFIYKTTYRRTTVIIKEEQNETSTDC